jgi:hypothetical protein
MKRVSTIFPPLIQIADSVYIVSTKRVHGGPILHTAAPALDPGQGRTKTGQLWAFARDDSRWGGTDPLGVAHIYAP